MATALMQARSSTDGLMYTWIDSAPDWDASGFPGPGTAQHIAVAFYIPDAGGGGGGVPDDNSVSNAKLADMTGPAFKMRLSGSGDPQDGTPTQAASILPVAAAGVKGLVTPPGGTVTFYRADGTFAAPPGAQTLASVLGNGADAGGIAITGLKLALYGDPVDHGSAGTTETIDWPQGACQTLVLNANCTLTFSSPGTGVTALTLILVQDATGGRVVTPPASVKNWPTLSTAANTTSIVNLLKVGSTYWAALFLSGVT